MTAIDPFASVRTAAAGTATRPAGNELGTDAFLQLLVAQLRYQNPLAPTDGTEFLAQTAQFTMVEKLNEMAEQSKNQTATNEVLAASTMIGRRVTFAVDSGTTPTPVATTAIDIGGNLPADAAAGKKCETTVQVYGSDGKITPLRVEFTRLDHDGANDWEVRSFVGTTQVSGPTALSFDASGTRTTPDLAITQDELNRITGTSGDWDARGITIGFGSSSDSARLRSTSGDTTISLRNQNGSDGHTMTGIVTGVRFDISGPVLRIGDREFPMTSALEVQMPPA